MDPQIVPIVIHKVGIGVRSWTRCPRIVEFDKSRPDGFFALIVAAVVGFLVVVGRTDLARIELIGVWVFPFAILGPTIVPRQGFGHHQFGPFGPPDQGVVCGAWSTVRSSMIGRGREMSPSGSQPFERIIVVLKRCHDVVGIAEIDRVDRPLGQLAVAIPLV